MSNLVNKERVALWVAALQDPTLIQGHGFLAQRDEGESAWKQCCLDVACQVALANGLEGVETQVNPMQSRRGYRWESGVEDEEGVLLWQDEWSVLPSPVARWYGLTGNDGDVRLLDMSREEFLYATEANDDRRWSFPTIAQAIRDTFLTEGGGVDDGDAADPRT
jgi:hypothetical protein